MPRFLYFQTVFITVVAVTALQAISAPTGEPVAKVLARVGPSCLAAKQAKELDGLWVDLNSAQQLHQSDSLGMESQEQVQDLRGAIYLVGEWREYLTAYQAGNKNMAYAILDRVLNNDSWLCLLPRSEVLIRDYEKYTVYFENVPCKNMGDLPLAIKLLIKLQINCDDPLVYQTELAQLKKLQVLYQELEKQNWETIFRECDQSVNAGADVVSRYRAMLLSYVVTGYLKLEAKYQLPVPPGQEAPDYTLALLKKAMTESDLVAVWRSKTFFEHLCPTMAPWDNDFNAGVDFCLKGKKLESESHFAEATGYYTLYSSRQML